MNAPNRPWACSHCDTDQHTTQRHDLALAALRREGPCGNRGPYIAIALTMCAIVVLLGVALLLFIGIVSA